MKTLILISWLLLALLNFSIIQEASSAGCTTSPTANEMVLSTYSNFDCNGGVSSSVTVKVNVCSQLNQYFSSPYVKADCATGSYTYYSDSACSTVSSTNCQNSCDSINVIALCKYVKWVTTTSKWRFRIAEFFLLCICINLHTTRKITSFLKSRRQKILSFYETLL